MLMFLLKHQQFQGPVLKCLLELYPFQYQTQSYISWLFNFLIKPLDIRLDSVLVRHVLYNFWQIVEVEWGHKNMFLLYTEYAGMVKLANQEQWVELLRFRKWCFTVLHHYFFPFISTFSILYSYITLDQGGVTNPGIFQLTGFYGFISRKDAWRAQIGHAKIQLHWGGASPISVL